MGQCQSRSVADQQQQQEHHQEKAVSTSLTAQTAQTSSPLRVFRSRRGGLDKINEESPASTKTISPSENTESTLDSIDVTESDHGLNLLSVLSSPSNQKLAPFPEEDEEEVEEEESDNDQDDGSSGSNLYLYGASTPSILYTDDIESSIPEEEDPDAPSDEEDFQVTPKWRDRAGPLVSSSLASRVGRVQPQKKSPPRTQASIKLRRGRVTNPQSIVHRPEPALVAPNEAQSNLHVSRDSVKPHTMAEFNRLKVQVKLANRQEKVKNRAAKLEDRYEDVRGYKSLWNEFENIERKLSEDFGSESGTPSKEPHVLRRSSSFDLKDVDSWYVDFQSLDGSEEDDDNESQCHLSLLSESSMEAQRLLFAEKSAERYRKAEQAKRERRENRKNKKIAEAGGSDENEGEEKKTDETPQSEDAAAKQVPLQPALTTPRELFRNKMGDDDSQDGASDSKASSYSQSHIRSSGRDYGPSRNLPNHDSLITNMEVSFSGQQRLLRTDSDVDDNTSQLSVDVDDYNDYHVQRRRRRHHGGDDESAASGVISNISFDEERMELACASDTASDLYGLDNLSLHSNEGAPGTGENSLVKSKGSPTKSPSKPAFGAPYLDRPEPRWREFSKEQVLMDSAAKCLRDVYSSKTLLSTDLDNDDNAFAEDEEKLIQIMTTDEFLRMSEGIASPVRLHFPIDGLHTSSPIKYDYGPARPYSPDINSNCNASPSKSPVVSSADYTSEEVNGLGGRIRDAETKVANDEFYYSDYFQATSPLKRSPIKDDTTPNDEPGAIVMRSNPQDAYVLRNNDMPVSSSPKSIGERYMV